MKYCWGDIETGSVSDILSNSSSLTKIRHSGGYKNTFGVMVGIVRSGVVSGPMKGAAAHGPNGTSRESIEIDQKIRRTIPATLVNLFRFENPVFHGVAVFIRNRCNTSDQFVAKRFIIRIRDNSLRFLVLEH